MIKTPIVMDFTLVVDIVLSGSLPMESKEIRMVDILVMLSLIKELSFHLQVHKACTIMIHNMMLRVVSMETKFL